ncbi:MAG TPA: RpiB/LacA/LacB family sugar-phosphate isomerase [Candidatus Saccharimonadales bacterium]|nr:RpiB/LacA/LacB family sugar-phosphate isomerase [Candidatus Saccharimonadales bacterium]
MKIALASDHAGFAYLNDLESFLKSAGNDVKNFGPEKLNLGDDYPDFILPAALAVRDGECDRGIVLGGSGQGEAMAANKVRGIRCAVYYGPAAARKVVDASGRNSRDPLEIIRLSREHNDSNMLSLAARFLTLGDMKQAIKLWLATEFSGDERHRRRNGKLDEFNR